MKRVRIKDIKQGRIIYQVYFINGDVWIEEYMLESKPYKTRNKSLGPFVAARRRWHGGEWGNITEKSLTDMNVVQNCYNNHRVFWKRKHAEKCAARFRDGCLTKKESQIVERKKELVCQRSFFYSAPFL